jgi:eukaryotic-like serine/threonine-protein kinase
MSQLREYWEGLSLTGDYTLQHWLGGDDSAGFFQTALPSGSRAVLKLVPERLVDGDQQLELWRRTRQLSHPNLVELLDFGRAGHNGESVVYAVFEYPDDTLASALSQSTLTAEESREVLEYHPRHHSLPARGGTRARRDRR